MMSGSISARLCSQRLGPNQPYSSCVFRPFEGGDCFSSESAAGRLKLQVALYLLN